MFLAIIRISIIDNLQLLDEANII